MKKSLTKMLSVLLTLVLVLSMGALTAFASGDCTEPEHVHTEECAHSVVPLALELCPHKNTYTRIDGQDVYADDNCHNSYEVTTVTCQDCGVVLTTDSRLHSVNPHNSGGGYYLQSFTHSADGTQHFYVYRRICTCGYSYNTTNVTACDCPKT